MLLSKTFKNFVIIRHCFFSKQSVPIQKSSSFLSVIRRKPVLLNKSEFKLIYDYPFIRIVSALNGSGKTNVFLSVAASPFIYYYFGSITPCLAVLTGASIHILMVAGYSNIFKNIVGKMYVNKEGEVKDVLISSIDKFGKRIDRIHKANDIINCDYHTKFTGQLGFIQISFQNSDCHYKLNVRNCKVYDALIWENLFGKTTFTEFTKRQQSKENEVKKIE